MVPIASLFYILYAFPEIPRVAWRDFIHRKGSEGLNSALSSGASGCMHWWDNLPIGSNFSPVSLTLEWREPSLSSNFAEKAWSQVKVTTFVKCHQIHLSDVSQHKNILAELTQTCRFLSSSHLVSATDGLSCMLSLALLAAPRPPSASLSPRSLYPHNTDTQHSSLDFISSPSAPCDLARIPDALPAAHISESAVSAFSGQSSEGKQPSSSVHKQLGSCGGN